MTDLEDLPPPGFDWDPKKNADNLKYHRIRFGEAIAAFGDISGYDAQSQVHGTAYGAETRFIWLGLASGIVLYICYTIRDDGEDGEITRVISARKADKHEVNCYYARSEL